MATAELDVESACRQEVSIAMGGIVLMVSLIALDVAAVLWGVDSRERLNSPEWERRRAWRWFH
jgi:hypothetical protein